MKQDLIYEYQQVQAQIEQLRQQSKKFASAIVHETTREYFERYGHLVHAITWLQYTPYFNDGEACEFSVHHPYALHKPLDDEDVLDDYSEDSDYYIDLSSFTAESINKRIAVRAGYDSDPISWSKNKAAEYNKRIAGSYRYRDDYFLQYPPENLTQEQLLQLLKLVESTPDTFAKDTQVLLNTISSIDEDVMKALFGDHVRIIITSDGVTSIDYSHE
jgi:hypothetical protein